MRRLFLAFIVIGVLFCCGTGEPQCAFAATIFDSESDDTTATANGMQLGDTISGTITETDNLDYYKFQLGSAGCLTLNMTSYMRYYCIIVYDADGQAIWLTDYNEWTETVGYRKDTYNLYLEQGIYYMQINGYRANDWDKSAGKYECSTSFLSSGVNNVENDNSFADANNIQLGNTIIGQISENDNYDTFKFEIPQAGCLTLDMTSYMRYYCMTVYNADGEAIWLTNYNEWTETVGYRKDTYDLYLEQGIYYMQINGYRANDWDKSTGKYEIKTAFVSSNTTFDGDDNSFANANPISWKENYIGQISINDDFDTYKFVVPTGMKVPISMTSYMRYYCIRIYDSDGGEVGYVDNREWNSEVGYRKDTLSIVLSAGTYYMQINGYRANDWDKSTGKYVFSIGTETTEEANKNKDNQKDSKEKATKKSKDDQTANPLNKAKKLKKVTKVSVTKKRKALKIKWKKVSGAIGYQVCYSTSSRFKKKNTQETSVTTITLKNLKAKKSYYVRIRAFSIVDGTRKYGNYSKVLKRKTK